MATSDLIATIGVSILLLAFFLQAKNIIQVEGYLYNVLNFIGAAIAGYGSWLVKFMPFVVLETVWCIVALYCIFKRYKSMKVSRETN
jgi:hypothetical protein